MHTSALLSALLWLAPQDAPAPASGQAPAPTSAPEEAAAQRLPLAALEGFSQTRASGVDDLFGQALLLEFFAHW